MLAEGEQEELDRGRSSGPDLSIYN